MAAGSNSTLFLRAGRERLDDARVLSDQGRYAGAVYLAGYAAECGLKALLLSAVPTAREREVIDSFRGAAAHNLYALRARYANERGPDFPPEAARAFGEVADWAVRLRYDPRRAAAREAERFVASAARLYEFCRDRI